MNLLKDVKAFYKVEDNLYIELTKEQFYEELYKLNERLQERIDKAIEYIEDGKNGNWVEINEILNILKGEE